MLVSPLLTSALRPLLLVLLTLPLLTPALRIATSLQWIEHTPQPYAIKNFYKGSTTASLVSGGVANLATDTTLDLAANAETQGLLQYASHKNLRLVYIICEVGYRLVATRSANITSLADLRGKRIGTMPGTSAAYFVSKMMGQAGVADGAYKVVSGSVCMKASGCGAGTLPAMLKGGQVDAFGIWEPAVELAIEALGQDQTVVFQNFSTYREVYSLYSTAEKLDNAATRKDIVAFVKALNQTLAVFRDSPDSSGVYSYVANQVGMDASVVKAVWPVHHWTGTWGPDLEPFLELEDQWVAKQNGRSTVAKADLVKFLDDSVIKEI